MSAARPPQHAGEAVAEALRTVAAAVRLKAPVLIHGDTGTGKEQLARHAHEASGRSGAPGAKSSSRPRPSCRSFPTLVPSISVKSGALRPTKG